MPASPPRILALRFVLVLLTLCLLAPWLPTAAGAGRDLILIDGADYFGHDYATRKDLSQADCQAACLGDARCRSFTYNVKTRWCFLKSDFGELRPFAGAVTGRILTGSPATRAERRAARLGELGLLPRGYADEARRLAASVAAAPTQGGTPPAPLVEAQAALDAGNTTKALGLYKQALRQAPEDPSLWAAAARAALAAKTDDWRARERYRKQASAAAINAYLRAEGDAERATALALLGRALAARSAWQAAIRADRASLALVEDRTVRARYDRLLAAHGFRILDHRVDAEAASPRICLQFSQPLPQRSPELADFVTVPGHPELAVEVEEQQVCIDGARHGERYHIVVRAGLPAADGERLTRPAELDVYVRDRAPAVRFLGRAYVLPKGGEAAIPFVSVNTDEVAATLYRIGDRALAPTIGDGTFLKPLEEYETRRIREQSGERLWSGTVTVAAELNKDVTTAVPIGELIADLEPGVYILTARPARVPDEDQAATQWFVVSDIGLGAFSGADGLHVVARALSTAAPLADLEVRLVARNNEVLAPATTDGAGLAEIPAGLLRGSGGQAPALLVAEGPDGDYGFLDLTKTPFDLTDRGVAGRPAPRPLDVYLVTERGVYRPGESVRITALLRDDRARALADLPLTLIVRRPDGVEHTRVLTEDGGLGGRTLTLDLLPSAMRGTWRVAAYGDPQAPALAEQPFAVEDFRPERLDFELAAPPGPIDPAAPPTVTLAARFLYGAPAGDLKVSGTTLLRPVTELADHPGFRFGLADEEAEPVSAPLPGTRTDATGQASLVPVLPEAPSLTRPQVAEVRVEVADTGGRPVERVLERPVAGEAPRIGIRPQFRERVAQGGVAAFDLIGVGPDGARAPLDGLSWTLAKVNRTFQWYRLDGRWDYEPIVSRQRVASGTLDLVADEPGHVEAAVDWGEYVLEVTDPSGVALPASVTFEAGWYVAPTAVDTPDRVEVALDKDRYRIGETARVHIAPRFAGQALILVLDDRLIAMRAVTVPESGTTLELPVTADWGPGAYVTAVVYRPMDLAEKQMPGRALGLAWAGVDPGERHLAVHLGHPEEVAPRGPLPLEVAIDNLPAGAEAYVTVAAVDVGILNLTGFQAPAPDDWYLGQRRLGVEIRDLYGQLIDRMQGARGQVRSGGGAGTLRLSGPPPTERLLALFSGIRPVDADGHATIDFELPDFNGTVRLMAMAWSANGVGHAVEDLIVRDPIVIEAALPGFLAPGDHSRLRLDLTQVEGPPGDAALSVTSAHGHVQIAPEYFSDQANQRVTLARDERTVAEIPIAAMTPGEDQLEVFIKTHSGLVLHKTLTLAVRDATPPVVETAVVPLPPGGQLTLGPERLGELVPGTGTLSLAIDGALGLDVPGLVRALDRYPYGCAEQLTSRALPLLYLDSVALNAGLGAKGGADAEAPQRIREAIAAVLAKQAAQGSFGAWGPGEGDLWLDAYVSDFLTRAREEGYEVKDTAFRAALDNLANRVAYGGEFDTGGEDIAYALYVLARNGRAIIGDLRYYAAAKLDDFATPLARAQLGAALALYGDRPRAEAAFASALALLARQADDGGWRTDYGSPLRDAAAVATLLAETGIRPGDLAGLGERLAALRAERPLTSTQEEAWLLLAAHALTSGATAPQLEVAGRHRDGPLYRRIDEGTLADEPLVIANVGERPLAAAVTRRGQPLVAPPAGGQGYRITRAYYDLDGRSADPARVAQGARLVVVVSVAADAPRAARLLVQDPLPAGFEIDNPHLLRAGDLTGLPWLDLSAAPAHEEFRSDRFVAALERGAKDPASFQLAYRVRAVSPGRFAHPAATVEDMYRPAQRAWTDAGEVEVTAP
ncbi:large extracellular alpha-helical protein [Thioflavicoccus mobilis 8321]|uniref:Large extracellular alpha-helical protein n=1 Tax=Thioflavicoccus mobilis 8321 TaxID=765912 RepID=L0H1B6_9GAMM|nr:alpha-2-macroglobulin family protein [Thioflavicoccus mobilis]AGA91852.1 large extracellular alpha-helical protein [Thioflavicoccus mobilis 8321]